MDIALNLTEAGADFALQDGDIALDLGLRTAVLVSLFSDAKVLEMENIPDGETDPRGWWGDTFESSPIGSLLWTVSRAKITNQTINRVRDSIEAGLAWLLEQNIASDLRVSVTRLDTDRILARIELERGDASQQSDLWDATIEGALTFETPILQVQLLTA